MRFTSGVSSSRGESGSEGRDGSSTFFLQLLDGLWFWRCGHGDVIGLWWREEHFPVLQTYNTEKMRARIKTLTPLNCRGDTES